MSRNLHTASTYQVHYTSTVIPGGDSQDILISLMSMFDVHIEDADEFEVQRSELVHLRDSIAENGDTDEEVVEKLQKLDMTKDELVAALNRIINESDQSNEHVLLSWY